ncbi:peptidylprolyl isomerase [Campylobacter concisus]|uniref:Peptidylprolyl isomerase n=1 Tax=Campylobacter concisus TaxID=199 RepID=A0AAE7TNW3_9BACT|nr:peptidylprolyl isomerase [Campylobacter concisus]QPH86169.1 peptidylprolyl isomerase [Campylobacter concisus]
MLSWMQKHKKYLVVTIWVSTIAFVGAGFVGWGAYDLNSNRATSVAKVGHRNISIQELQQKYDNLYQYYNNLFDGKLTQEKANELGLQNAALQATIQENLLLNFADDIGLSVSKDDILKYIIADPTFQKDGTFDKNLYYDILRRARINPTDFEENLKLTILLDKLRTILNLPASKEDIAMMEASFFMQDKLAIQIINANQSDIKIDEKELKNLWETNKNNYMTKTIYGLETYFIESNKNDVNQTTLSDYYNENKERYKGSDDKIKSFDEVKTEVVKDYNIEKSKTDALKKYTSIKKAELATNEFVSINEDNATFSLDEIKGAKVGEVIKPFTYKDGYLIVRVKSITPPQPMSFEQARAMVLKIYKDKKKKENLITIAKESLQNFKGTDIGFISRDINGSILGLNESETRTFVSQLFETNNKKEDYVILEDKAVIYDILEQRLLVDNIDNNYKQITQQNVTMLKNNELIKDLTNKLKKYYEIKEYIKR